MKLGGYFAKVLSFSVQQLLTTRGQKLTILCFSVQQLLTTRKLLCFSVQQLLTTLGPNFPNFLNFRVGIP